MRETITPFLIIPYMLRCERLGRHVLRWQADWAPESSRSGGRRPCDSIRCRTSGLLPASECRRFTEPCPPSHRTSLDLLGRHSDYLRRRAYGTSPLRRPSSDLRWWRAQGTPDCAGTGMPRPAHELCCTSRHPRGPRRPRPLGRAGGRRLLCPRRQRAGRLRGTRTGPGRAGGPARRSGAGVGGGSIMDRGSVRGVAALPVASRFAPLGRQG